MKSTLSSLFWMTLFLFKSGLAEAQCPTQGIPTTTNKGKFELDFKGTKYTVDGITNNKITVCANSSFTVTDKSGRTGIYFYFNTTRTAFPVPPANYALNNTATINTPATPGQYILAAN